MRARQRILLNHFGLGVGGLALFALVWGRPPKLADIPVIVSVALVDAYCQYLSEHEAFPEWMYRTRDYGRSHPLVVVAATVAIITVMLTPLYVFPSTVRWYFDVFFGVYIGFIGYRIVYGLVLPVPEPALGRV